MVLLGSHGYKLVAFPGERHATCPLDSGRPTFTSDEVPLCESLAANATHPDTRRGKLIWDGDFEDVVVTDPTASTNVDNILAPFYPDCLKELTFEDCPRLGGR